MTIYHVPPASNNDRWCDALLMLRPFIWSALLLLLLFTSGLTVAPAAAACSPNPNGNPGCSGAGNPVNVLTGNKYQHEVDLAPLPGVLGLRFERHYNSGSTHRGLTGVGWRSTYEVVLVDVGSEVQIIDADGTRRTFAKDPQHTSLCVSARPEDGRVVIEQDKGGGTDRRSYRWQRLDGAEYLFAHGTGGGYPLQSITAASGERVTLNYLGGVLDSVRDAQGRELKLVYERGGAGGRDRALVLSAIDTPLGRLRYARDERGRLITVTQPNALVHRYHYEAEHQAGDPYLLTGISVEYQHDRSTHSDRIASYRYDARGRATRTQHAGGDDLALAYDETRQLITVTTASGARTVYKRTLISGQWTLTDAKGPGCSTCPPSNVRYIFNRAGQREREEQLDERGQIRHVTQTRFDASGRPLRVERIEYQDGKPTSPRLLLRAEYTETAPRSSKTSAADFAARWRPLLVARPSVTPGREHTLTFTYNQRLQTTSVTERGFSPIDDYGQNRPRELSRTTSYRYQTIVGASRLIAIDGPLPGVADTTTLHYDEFGRLRVTQHPVSDLQERFAYDAAGRVTLHIPTDAVAVRTRYPDAAQTLANRPLLPASIERAARTTQYQFNSRGWVTQWNDGPQRTVSLTYNSEGRVVEARDAQGNRVTSNRDEAKQLEATLWFDSSQANASTPTPQRGYYRWFDSADRTLRTLTPDGRVDEYVYDAQGRLTHHFDSDGVAHLHLFKQGARGVALQARIDWAPDDQVRLFMGGRAASNATPPQSSTAHRRLRDDFARVVRVDLPEHGARVAQYDEADQVRRIVFADGAKVEYAHDAAGRMVRKTVIGADGSPESAIALRYHGAYLIEVIDPAQHTEYRYDSAGRKTEARITLAALSESANAQTYTMGTSYDAQGETIEHRLADGRTMTVERDLTTRLPNALLLKANGLRPAQQIVTGIGAHPFNGITGFTHGNGVVTARGYDTAGRLTTLRAGGVLDLRYEYQAGPRIRAIRDANVPAQSVAGTLDYDGFGALKAGATIQRASVSEPLTTRGGVVRTNFGASAPQNAVERDSRGRLLSDDQHLYRYDALDRLIAVQERASQRLVARYVYNAFAERVGKTTFDANGTPKHRQFLYQRSQLVAEIAVGDGSVARIEQQYVYLNSAPVAMLESERVLAIHTDHRGAPLAMTDAQQRVVWKATYRDAWGQVQAVDAPPVSTAAWKALLHKTSAGRLGETAHGAAQLNLRLPGQYADAETGLHYNLHRYYDPRTGIGRQNIGMQRVSFNLNSSATHGQGRYLTPDPLGHPDGPDPYLYARGDPVNNIDSFGLYATDVHFYMTFFLARIAGISHEEALTIASAAQFIDDNYRTAPIPVNALAFASFSVIEDHNNRLRLYHFMEGLNGFEYPQSDQLTRLRSASARASTRCARAQFFGEFLHAFEDTFSHRNQANTPIGLNIGPLSWGPFTIDGVARGHLEWGSSPDRTFNHSVVNPDDPRFINQPGNWFNNESRTLRMEESVFEQLTTYSGLAFINPATGNPITNSQTGRPLTYAEVFGSNGWLMEWNRLQDETDKIFFLDEKLRLLSLGALPLYAVGDANTRRNRNLCGLAQADYPGTMLPNSTCPRGPR